MKGEDNVDNKVKEIRIKKGLSQEELANKSNISRYLISKIENGEDVNLTKNTMISISKALEKPVIEVFML
nr:MAG: antitoxin component [Bacteriophage sp.]